MLILKCGASARAQCEAKWLPGEGIPGINGIVYATIFWDPDGSGPRGPQVVAGGNFSLAGNTACASIAMWEDNHWVRLGSGLSSSATVYSLAVDSEGKLLAGGQNLFDGAKWTNIARWNGTAWGAVGSGVGSSGNPVNAIAVLPDGRVVVGGSFAVSASQILNVAIWEDGTWKKLDAGLNDRVDSILAMPDGRIVAAGGFSASGAKTMRAVAQWNGQAWEAMGNGLTSGNGTVGRGSALTSLPNGDILVAGKFDFAGGVEATNIARWNGLKWVGMNSAILGQFSQGGFAVGVMANGDVVAVLDNGNCRVMRLSNGTWSSVGGEFTLGSVRALVVSPSGQIIAGGAHRRAGPHATFGISAWDGTRWTALGRGFGDGTSGRSIDAMVTLPNGNLVVGGDFELPDSSATQSLAQWDGINWRPVGGSVNGRITALAVLPDGGLVAGGVFSSIGSVSFLNIAKWDGQRWSSLGTGLPVAVRSMAVTPSGGIVASGEFTTIDGITVNYIARWNGLKWEPLGAGLQTYASALAVTANGSIVAAGGFATAGGVIVNYIARWDGLQWNSFGSGLRTYLSSGEFRLVVLANDDVVVANGSLYSAGGINVAGVARWTGSQWKSMGNPQGNISSFGIHSSGVLLAGTGGTNALGMISWTGSSWKSFGKVDGSPNVLANLRNGEIAVGGSIRSIDGDAAQANFARWSDVPRPWIVVTPEPQQQIAGTTALIRAAVGNGFASVSYQWQQETVGGSFIDIADGIGGVSQAGGTVSGASGQLPSPTDGTPATLTISNIQPSDAGIYRVTFWNSCGEATSVPVEVKVKAHITDINADGQVDDADFLLFTTQYDLMLCADPLMSDACSADFNHDGVVDDADFGIFVPAYHEMLF
ncbi:MAG: hypothetical protein U0570_02755 [Phycisphaerales bacterium]